MATIVTTKPGPGSLTIAGKRFIAAAMYDKGKRFLGATLLLRKADGDSYVVRHLLCQGVELVLKGLLLAQDYDQQVDRLKKPLGHNLVAAADSVADAYEQSRVDGEIRAELVDLNKLYGRHLLRYGSIHDVFIDASTIPYRGVLRRVGALVRLVQRRRLFDS